MTTYCCEAQELNKFVKEAKPNSIFLYYVGCSVQDTILSKEIGKLAYDLAKQGQVYLVMRRATDYYFDFEHYLIKASPTPVYSLVPFADEKTEQLRKLRGVRSYGKDQRTSENQRKLERYYSVR